MQARIAVLGTTSKLYEITISPQLNPRAPSPKDLALGEEYAQLLEEHAKTEEEVGRLRAYLDRQRERCFIMQGYFAKIQRIVYNKESQLFEGPLLDYEKAELHMREIVRRLADIHNQKLNVVPVVYRNNNIKVYRHTPNNK